MKKTLFLLALIAVVVAIAVYFSNTTPKTEKQAPIQKVTLEKQAEPVVSSVETSLKMIGEVEPATTVWVQFKVGGKLESGEIELKEGQRFKKDQLLFQVNNRDAFQEMLSIKTALKEKIETMILPQLSPEEREKWETFAVTLGPASLIGEFPVINDPKEKQLIDSKEIAKDYQKIKKQETAMADYFYLAPFDGIVLESKIPTGKTYLKEEMVVAKIGKIGKRQIKATIGYLEYEKLRNSDEKFAVYSDKNKMIGKAKLVKAEDTHYGAFIVYFAVDNWKKLALGETVSIVEEK